MARSYPPDLLSVAQPLLKAEARPSTTLQRLGVRFMVSSAQTAGAFAVVEHPLAPLTLAAPYHTHSREDEYSIVLDGEVTFALDERLVVGRPGDTIFKPRDVRHTFWNAGNAPARLLEVIAPGGFENYFAEIGEVFASPVPDLTAIGPIAAVYGLRVERETIPDLIARYGLNP